MIAVVYADGHVKSTRPSRLICGNFYGVPWGAPVVSVEMDVQESMVP
jgi:hypothetical protein